ncbi:MAG: hypothetical protein H6R14_1402 [Proteobacteria bacterium]|nr:hypothetical protein [Pseudomonadota bacterium]
MGFGQWMDEYGSTIQLVGIVLAVGYSVMARRKVNGRRERPEPSAARFFLYLIAAVVCSGIAWFCFQYLRDHHGDYANYLMIIGLLASLPFAAGFLLGALLEGLRVVLRR